jgi:hypothetical protein
MCRVGDTALSRGVIEDKTWRSSALQSTSTSTVERVEAFACGEAALKMAPAQPERSPKPPTQSRPCPLFSLP